MGNDIVKLSVEQAVNVVELILPDGLDSEEFDNFNERLKGLIEGKASAAWVLDLARVEYMGSAALGLMVNIRQQIKSAAGKLALCNMNPRLAGIFRTCCLEKLFTIRANRPDAIRAVR